MNEGGQAVLFDKDGTLIDFDRTWQPAYTHAARALVRAHPSPMRAAELLDAGGLGPDGRWRPGSVLASGSNAEIAELWASVLGVNDVSLVLETIEPLFHATVTAEPVPVTDLKPVFEALIDLGFILGVATMDDERTARESLDALGVAEALAFVCGADSGFGVKPEPGMVEGFMQAIGVPARQIAVVGDSPHDLNMARSAGAGLHIGVLSGAHDADTLAPLCHYLLEDITELPALLRGRR